MRMRNVFAVAVAVMLGGAVGVAQTAGQGAGQAQADVARQMQKVPEHGEVIARATAEIRGEGITGTADFVEYQRDTQRWVQMTLRTKGLKPNGLRGVHLHAVGKCDPPEFKSAGGHFDPGPAGDTDPDANHPFHMGDLPNLRVNEKGEGELIAVTTRVTLTDGPLSVFDEDGTALMVHANEDKGVPGPSGSGVSGGPRVACGVLKKAQ
jgi:superoxide dismutase, Cu-Zn family